MAVTLRCSRAGWNTVSSPLALPRKNRQQSEWAVERPEALL